MAASASGGGGGAGGGGARQPRRGPAPIASFDHDGSDESSPETKPARLPEIRETPAGGGGGGGLAPGEQRARSHSTPAATALAAPPAPRIDISRASSSSHHDSRDSSPELALFTGAGSEDARQRLELGFREDGALDLRSSTEELSFLEPAPGEPRAHPAAPPPPPAAPPPPPCERRHSRKDSQSSEAALLGVSGRTSRLSSVGSQGSAVSAVSRVSRLSVVSGASRSPSPHRMLLETSFCGPKPIETDPEACAAAVAEHILDIVKLGGEPPPPSPALAPALVLVPVPAPVPTPVPTLPPTVDARDHREVRTEATVETAPAPALRAPAPAPAPPAPRACPEERRARPRVRREPSEPEVYKSRNRSKDIIRIKLKPDEEDVDEDESEPPAATATARPPETLALGGTACPAGPGGGAPASPRRRSPSPSGAGAPVSRKSSFCSLFKSRETIASPDSPSEALRRKRSLTEGRSRSKSRDRDRAATPSSAGKLRGSVLSLFRTPRRSLADSGAGSSRDASPAPAPAPRAAPHTVAVTNAPLRAGGVGPPPPRGAADRLKYYEDTRDGIIHIPLRTPPDENGLAPAPTPPRRGSGGDPAPAPHPRDRRPASAPAPRALPDLSPATAAPPPSPAPAAVAPPPPGSRGGSKPLHRTVLPDGTIIIPLHSPTERVVANGFPEPSPPASTPRSPPEPARPVPPGDGGEARGPSSPPPAPEPAGDGGGAGGEDTRRRRKERLVFTTHVGSREQVFSTQFSITKTPSVTSEISGSFPSFADSDPPAAAPVTPMLRDTHVGASPPPPGAMTGSAPATPQEPPRDSSESEPSSEAATPRAGNDVERRGLVVQESFEEELPYVPTTLPQERTMMLPMVPVRERGGVRVASVQRPRGSFSAGGPRVPPTPSPTVPVSTDKLRIKLPRRPRPAPAPAPAPVRSRTRSGSESGAGAGAGGGEARPKQEWIDFEEVPERRKQPKRIQTLPAGATGAAGLAGAGGGGVVFSYVEPEHCRCECHAHAHAAGAGPGAPPDDGERATPSSRISTPSSASAEGGDEEPEHVVPECAPAPAPAARLHRPPPPLQPAHTAPRHHQ